MQVKSASLIKFYSVASKYYYNFTSLVSEESYQMFITYVDATIDACHSCVGLSLLYF